MTRALPPGLDCEHPLEDRRLRYRIIANGTVQIQIQCRCGQPIGSAIGHHRIPEARADLREALRAQLDMLLDARGRGDYDYQRAKRTEAAIAELKIAALPEFDADKWEWRREHVHRAIQLRGMARRMAPRSDFMSDEQWEVYRHSLRWRRKLFKIRREANAPGGGGCFVCGGPAVLLHHLRYDNIGNEPREDLEPLCDPCHSWVHDRG